MPPCWNYTRFFHMHVEIILCLYCLYHVLYLVRRDTTIPPAPASHIPSTYSHKLPPSITVDIPLCIRPLAALPHLTYA